MFKINSLLAIFLFCLSSCYSQKTNNKQQTEVDSIRIRFFADIMTTTQERPCDNIYKELNENPNSYYITIKNPYRIKIIEVDFSRTESIDDYDGGIYVDAVIEQFKQGEKEYYCLNLSGSDLLFDNKNNVYQFFRFTNGYINSRIFEAIMDDEVYCGNENCNSNAELEAIYFYLNMIRNYKKAEL